MVTPRGLPTVGWFEWGAGTNHTHTTASVELGDGRSVVPVSAHIEGRTEDSLYSCRLVASNSFGISYGAEQWFTTGRRVALWGRPRFISTQSSFLPLADLGNVVKVSAGDYHGLALKPDGTVAAWGNYHRSVPVTPPAGLSNVIDLVGGQDHTIALKRDGTLVTWGDNWAGRLDLPAGLTNVVAISAGDSHTLALKGDGTLAGWGSFGFGSSGSMLPPQHLPRTNIVALSSGDTYGMALRDNGTVLAWGGTSIGNVQQWTNVVAISADYLFALALKADGTVLEWGSGPSATVPTGLSKWFQSRPATSTH